MHDEPVLKSRLKLFHCPQLFPPAKDALLPHTKSSAENRNTNPSGIRFAKQVAIDVTHDGQTYFATIHASPSSSGVTATVKMPWVAWKRKEPNLWLVLAEWSCEGSSFTNNISRMCLRASAALVAIGTSSVITATSASKSIPCASLMASMLSFGRK